MAYDTKLADRIRAVLAKRNDVVEKPMFGGVCFMVGGHMCCGLTQTEFVVRVGPTFYDEALAQAHVRPMTFTGRPLRGMVYVSDKGLRTSANLSKWVERGLAFVETLHKKSQKKARRAKPKS